MQQTVLTSLTGFMIPLRVRPRVARHPQSARRPVAATCRETRPLSPFSASFGVGLVSGIRLVVDLKDCPQLVIQVVGR